MVSEITWGKKSGGSGWKFRMLRKLSIFTGLISDLTRDILGSTVVYIVMKFPQVQTTLLPAWKMVCGLSQRLSANFAAQHLPLCQMPCCKPNAATRLVSKWERSADTNASQATLSAANLRGNEYKHLQFSLAMLRLYVLKVRTPKSKYLLSL